MLLNKRVELIGHAAPIYAVFAKNNTLYTASGDKFVARWNVNELKQDNFALKSDSSNYAIAMLHESSVLVIGTSSGAFYVIDTLKKIELHHFIQHKVALFSIQENLHKNHVYITDADGNLSVWDKKTWGLILFLPLLVGKIRDILVSEDGESIFLACQDGTIRCFDTQFFNEKIVFKLAENNSNHWKNIDLDSLNQNSTGFTAIPTGCMNEDGSFKETYTSCYWWSNSHYYQNFSCYFNIDLKSKNHNHLNGSQNIGMPVRCVKD
jgi:WD40 repeat protein